MKISKDESSHRTNSRLVCSDQTSILIIFLVVFFLIYDGNNKSAIAQSAEQASSESPTTIGGTGFKVPIPEIRMNKIIGDQGPKKAVSDERRRPAGVPSEGPDRGGPLHPYDPSEQMSRPGPIPMRLPFDSRHRKTNEDALVEETSPKEDVRPSQVPMEPGDDGADRSRLRFVPPAPSAGPQRVPPEDQTLPKAKEQPPQETMDRQRSLEKQRSEPHHGSPFREPIAPVSITDSLPEPTKEIISKRMIHLPHMLEVEVARDTVKSLPVEVEAIDRNNVELEILSVDSRRSSPLMVDVEEQPKTSEPKEDSSTLVKDREAPRLDDAESHAPMSPPVEGQEPVLIPPKEQKPSIEVPLTKEEAPSRPDQLQVIEPKPTPAPAKERIPSPLDEETVMTSQLKSYLKETAPILEELSLLMARTPSLSIADFDPSETQATSLPKDINLKMETMKRELRILDSKVFAIIPPTSYTKYHNLIRQSINHTYMATEAFINFFNDSNAENLNSARENLAKAKEYIQQTVH